jgi:uncharacterized membrane protein
MYQTPRFGPLVATGAVLGVGLGGFIDGIVLHQLLQVHEMLSAWRPPVTLLDKSVNMFWDGLFHVFTWLTTAVGVGMLWRVTGRADVARSGEVLVGSTILGWGLFNVIEGVIDHQLLNIHNVVENTAHHTAWNLGFLALSIGLILLGRALIARGRRRVHGLPVIRPAPEPELAGAR